MSTIFSLSSGSLPAAIAIFRLSGKLSLEVLQTLTLRKKWIPREMRYAKLYCRDKRLIDNAMAVYLPGPSTFTGEDTTELYIHGSRAVARCLAEELSTYSDLRQARPGEFTKRAFYNGKLDLGEVRGLRSLLMSETQRQRDSAFHQMRGTKEAKRLRDKIGELVMKSYILMDFGEHVQISLQELQMEIAAVQEQVSALERRSRGAELLSRGLRAVLVGRPNAGKSSILNALADRDVAIVSHRAGTTRDVIEVKVELCGVPVVLADTAGLRDTEDSLELEGIRRTNDKLCDADIVVAVTEADDDASEVAAFVEEIREKEKPMILVRNKSDLTKGNLAPSDYDVTATVDTCALNNQGVQPLAEALSRIVSDLCPPDNGPCLTDHLLLREAMDCLTEAMTTRDAGLVGSGLEHALELFGQMAGEIASEKLLDDLFKQFCIGK